jgi:hypothetical protein
VFVSQLFDQPQQLLGHHVRVTADVDILEGTPLLDIKPYVPRLDCSKPLARAGSTVSPTAALLRTAALTMGPKTDRDQWAAPRLASWTQLILNPMVCAWLPCLPAEP